MTAELGFWPLFNMAVFKKAPIHLQSTFIYIGTIFWAMILSAIEERAISGAYDREQADKWNLPIIDLEKWLAVL
jgi:hypothetical protein